MKKLYTFIISIVLLSPLSAVQDEILRQLGLSALYRELEMPGIQT